MSCGRPRGPLREGRCQADGCRLPGLSRQPCVPAVHAQCRHACAVLIRARWRPSRGAVCGVSLRDEGKAGDVNARARGAGYGGAAVYRQSGCHLPVVSRHASWRPVCDGGRCEGCHGVDAFAPATRFNHDRDAGFALAGAHAKVACGSCHKPTTKAGAKPSVIYRGLSRTCESCHAGRPLGRHQ